MAQVCKASLIYWPYSQRRCFTAPLSTLLLLKCLLLQSTKVIRFTHGGPRSRPGHSESLSGKPPSSKGQQKSIMQTSPSPVLLITSPEYKGNLRPGIDTCISPHIPFFPFMILNLCLLVINSLKFPHLILFWWGHPFNSFWCLQFTNAKVYRQRQGTHSYLHALAFPKYFNL